MKLQDQIANVANVLENDAGHLERAQRLADALEREGAIPAYRSNTNTLRLSLASLLIIWRKEGLRHVWDDGELNRWIQRLITNGFLEETEEQPTTGTSLRTTLKARSFVRKVLPQRGLAA